MGTKTLDVPGGQTLVVPDPEMPEKATRRRYTAEYKAKVLAEYEQLDKQGKGELLRREGLYTSLISIISRSVNQGSRRFRAMRAYSRVRLV